jgi:hypothetical protein
MIPDFYAVKLNDLIDREVPENPGIISSHYAAAIRASCLKRQVDTRHQKVESQGTIFMISTMASWRRKHPFQLPHLMHCITKHAVDEISCWPETRVDEFFFELFGSIEPIKISLVLPK